jgi:hypothetical protein
MSAVMTSRRELSRPARYAQIVKLSTKGEWQIDRDLIRERTFDFSADAEYFIGNASRVFDDEEKARIASTVLGAYRWQYIVSGVQNRHFGELLTSMTTPDQMARIRAALAPIVNG